MKHHSRWIALLALVAGFGVASSAHADWTFTASATASTTDATTTFANTSYTGPPTLNISGAYAANGASNTGFAASSSWVSGDSLSKLNSYGGALGMASDGAGTPNHAIDNVGINTEAVMLTFGSSVVLTSIGLSYVSGDADVSLFRWNGNIAPPSSMNGTLTSATSAASTGWQLVGNYADFVVDTSAPFNTVNASNVGSSWWLISAYNTGFGLTSQNGGVLSQGNDNFKIYAVAGYSCTTGDCGKKVPEPGSLALVSVGLVGALGFRRRLKASSNMAAA